jgi:hypothetical protein
MSQFSRTVAFAHLICFQQSIRQRTFKIIAHLFKNEIVIVSYETEYLLELLKKKMQLYFCPTLHART